MTHPHIDPSAPGMATETTYSYERALCARRLILISTHYQFRPVTPTCPNGPYSYTVHRWRWNVGTGPEIGTVVGDTPQEAVDMAREMACDDLDGAVDQSPAWWRGAELVR